MQAAAQNADHQLHDAEVVQHRNQRGEEHDHRQNAQREYEAAAAEHLEHLVGHQPAENERNALIAVGDNVCHAVRHTAEDAAAQRHVQHQRADADLMMNAHTTVRSLMARRLLESSTAMAISTAIPTRLMMSCMQSFLLQNKVHPCS